MNDLADFIAFDRGNGLGIKSRVLIRADHIPAVEEIPQANWNDAKQMRVITKNGGRYTVLGHADSFLRELTDQGWTPSGTPLRYALDLRANRDPPGFGSFLSFLRRSG